MVRTSVSRYEPAHSPAAAEITCAGRGCTVVRGWLVIDGYRRASELTAEALRRGCLRTDDMARRDNEGYLYIVDRRKDMIVSGGFTVYPHEVEDALTEYPRVAMAAPEEIEIVDALPLTPPSKPDRRAIRERAWAGARRLIGAMRVRSLILGGLLVTCALSPASAFGASGDPPLTVPSAALRAALSCPASFAHSRQHEPVLLVHGTGLNAQQSWAWNYGQVLPRQGFDVCEVTLPDHALGDIQVATQYVVWAIEQIAARSGRRVDVITHSQGGMEGRWAVRWWPRARADVDDMVLIASPNHGISTSDACGDSGNCWPAVWQMRTTAAFIHVLNSETEAPAGPSYTNVYSLTDELVEPSSTVPMGGTNVANVAVQSLCPGRAVNHAGLLDDAVAYAITMDALGHAGPADPARVGPLVCTQAFMPGITATDAAGGQATLYSDAAQAFAAHPGVHQEPALACYTRSHPTCARAQARPRRRTTSSTRRHLHSRRHARSRRHVRPRHRAPRFTG